MQVPLGYTRMLTQAKDLLGAGKIEDAGKIALRLIQRAPKYPDAYVLLARISEVMGDEDSALAMYHHAIERDSTNCDSIHAAVEICFSQRKFALADEFLQKGRLHHPQDLDLMYVHAKVLFCLQEKEKSLRLFKEVCAHAPEREQDISILMHALEGSTPQKSSDGYVRDLFNSYAQDFEDHLLHNLQYQVPQTLKKIIISQLQPTDVSWKVADVGCGTGLMGEELYPFCAHLIAIDLADKMVEKACQRQKEGRKIYQEGCVGNAQDILQRYPNYFHGIVAADVFVYVGDFDEMFRAIEKSLMENGWFAYSVEEHNGTDFVLRESGRFAHAHDYVTMMLTKHGFTLIHTEKVILRKDRDTDIWGRMYLAQKTSI